PYPWELFDEDLSAGDTMPAGRLVGALTFSFGEYKVEPLDNDVATGDRIFFPETDDTFPRPDAPALSDGNDVAAFNVLNYFNTFGNSAVLRGAQNQEQFDVQSAKIVDAIIRLDAAVVGLVEIENDYEDFYDDDDTTVPSIVTLVDQLNDVAGKNTWGYIRPNENILTTEGLGGGGLGPDAIAVGIIYQRKLARAVGVANTFNIDELLQGDFDNNRWPLAQTFKIDGEDVTVIVNHFKSKGSTCTDTAGPGFDFGDDAFSSFTANCDLTRRYAAERLVEWADAGATNKKTDNVLLVGDFNAYEEEAPIEILVDAGYVDLVEEYGDDASTFKFSGRFGRLDYAFASPSLADDVTDAEVWQINSPAPTGYLYFNDHIDLTAHGSSDHDPVVVSLG
ncbi:MAG: ExeM/NucH family extracellular endonuclease, partial [Acidimicrobiales bacterium]